MVYTPPFRVDAERVSASRIRISWENSDFHGSTARLFRSINGAGFVALRDVTVAGFTQEEFDDPFGLDASAQYTVGYVEPGGSVDGATTSSVLYALPAAATGIVVGRTSDTSHTVAWTRNPTPTAPYGPQDVLRRVNGGALALIATVAPDVTSFVDPTTAPDSRYEWVIRVRLAGGSFVAYAESAPSAEVSTTPATPTGFTAIRNPAGGIDLDWDDASQLPGIAWELLHSTNAFATWDVLTTTQAKALTAYPYASPNPALPHYFNLRARVGSGTTPPVLLVSGWASSPAVNLVAPPAAPSPVGPSTAQDPAKPITLDWTHNPVDASPQRKRQVRYRYAGVTAWTTGSIVTSATSEATIAAGTLVAGGSLEWQVSTWGEATTGGRDGTGASAWSATSSFPLSTTPTVTLTMPATITTSRLTVPFTYYDAESTAQAAWQAQLVNGSGTVVESPSGTSESSVTFATVLPNTSTWTVKVRVQDTSGLWSDWATETRDVAYALPPLPTVTGVWDPVGGKVTLTIVTAAPGAGEVAATHVDVSRSLDGGATWELVAQGAPASVVWPDYVPTIKGTNRYRVTAVSAIPSTRSREVDVVASGAVAVFVNGGPGFSVACTLASNVEISDQSGRDRVIKQFDGRDYPSEIASSTRGARYSLRGDYIPTSPRGGSTPSQWRALADFAGPHMLRDVDGTRVPVSIGKPRITRGRSGVAYQVELDMERVG